MEKLNEIPKEIAGEVERDGQTEKMLRFMGKLKAQEFFGNEELKREFIQNLDFGKFKNLLFASNALLRDITINKRAMDGKDVELIPVERKDFAAEIEERKPEYPPRYEDKEDLLKKLFSVAKEIEKGGAKLEDIALMASAAINAIHPFMDGNGRMSRLVYFLFTENYNGTNEQLDYLRKILGDKGRLFINIDPGSSKDAITEYIFSNELGLNKNEPSFPSYLALSTKECSMDDLIKSKLPVNLQGEFTLHIKEESSDFGFFAVYKYLKDTNQLDNFLTKKIDSQGELKRTYLKMDDIINGLKDEDFQNILNVYWDLKKKSVSILIDALADPEKYLVDCGMGETTIKELFIKNIDVAQETSFQEVNFQDLSQIWPELSSLTYTQEKVPSQEMQIIQEIRKKALEIIQKDDDERARLNFDFKKAEDEISSENKKKYEISEGDPEFKNLIKEITKEAFNKKREIYNPLLEISEKNLLQFFQFIDGLDLWQYKFSTRKDEYGLTDEQQKKTDSIYYVTKTGVSLRILKYSLLKEGLQGTIQPFFEKILYSNKESGEVSEKPEVGLEIFEYASDEFVDAQNSKQTSDDFISRVRRYEKDGKPYFINPVDSNMHIGYPINKIFELKGEV